MKTRKAVNVIATLIFLAAAGCGSDPTPTPLPPTTTPLSPSPTAIPTATTLAAPISTPTSTTISAPTRTILPSQTSPPTGIPSQTLTPSLSQTPTPSPSQTSTPFPSPTHTPTHTPTPPPSFTPTPAVVTVPIGDLDAGRVGQEVTVSGQVVETASFAQGFKFTLDDGRGQVVLLMWHNVYDDCWDAPELNLGATVRATGEVGQYEGELQVEPGFGGDVKVTAPGNPLAPQQEIGAIGDYRGQRVTIVGQVLRVEGTGSGAKIFVGDDTGETLVFIWNNVLERVPQNQGLGTPGTRVRVTGVVQEYRSNLEVVPALPYDVQVLQ